ncbi:M20 family metallopeptidase [Xanthobacter autotrophicus]|uniref:M20 aminoacylase family protein n=1 Tax=Xanthobacter autotrophicus TaxID=280 RepID=UPI001E3D0486|nr:M20 aminoacylase family protein [Xanthobacter autotrophicus]UDQ88974.1 M20 family metallopeptidase [Xanthobacter autotrophicus]
MPVNNHIAARADEIAAWRQDFHRHPELMYDLDRTSAAVADKLRAFGCDEVITGIGRTGVVGIVRGKGDGPLIGLRADMDALPILEKTGAAYASQTPGKMHACGHDGHTAMLLGAARHLAETRAFSGTAVLIFQPAEEGGAGAKAMIDDGLFARFPVREVYGMHNLPGLEVGRFAMRPGGIMASADHIEIVVDGRGAHAARPNQGVDVVLTGAAIVMALQQIVSRNVDPLEAAVVSIAMFHAGEADNVLPPSATLVGTARTLDQGVRAQLRERIRQVAEGVAAAYGATATVSFKEGYPVTCNHADQVAFAAEVASEVAGASEVDATAPPLMAAEDFAYMLEEKPGAYIFIGNGPSAGLHHPQYDFADAAIPYGASYWVRLVERALPLTA